MYNFFLFISRSPWIVRMSTRFEQQYLLLYMYVVQSVHKNTPWTGLHSYQYVLTYVNITGLQRIHYIILLL